MDRIDDLLIKARAEMIGKAPKRNVVTKDDAFNMAWDMVKGYEDQMRALQEKRNKPGFFGRMKDAAKSGYQSARQPRPQQNQTPLPTRSNEMRATTPNAAEESPSDPFGQRDGPPSMETTAAQSVPPTMAELGPGGIGQGGGAEALEPEAVPMREENAKVTRRVPRRRRAPGPTGPPPAPAPAPVETERTRSLPPTMRPGGIGPSQRARNLGGPSDDKFVSAVQTLVPDSDYRSLLTEVNERRRGKEPQEGGVSPLSSADVRQGSPMPKLSARTQGNLDRDDPAANEEYQQASDKRMEYAEAMEGFVERGDMTEDEAFDLWGQMQQSGNIPQFPKMKEEAQPSLDEATRVFGGETLRPNTRSPAVEPPIQETTQGGVPTRRTGMKTTYPNQSTALVPTKKEPATQSLEPEEVMAMQGQPRGGVPAVRGEERKEPPATQALGAGEVKERFMLPERTDAQAPPQSESRKNMRSPITMREPRPGFEERQLPSKKRREERDRRNTAADEVEAKRTPAPQPDKPQVQEQTPKEPPQGGEQPTLFGGEEQTTPKPTKNNKATVEEAQKRKANRAGNKETTQALPRIGADTDSEAISALMDRAEEGDEKARKHLYNAMGDLEDHHPSQAKRYNELFGKMPQEANLSLLPSGMRQSILKDNDTDVNYSLLPNGWA